MPFYYQAFGMILQSSRPIPGLVVARNKTPVDLRIDLEGSLKAAGQKTPKQLFYESPADADGFFFRVWKLEKDAGFRFEYRGGPCFWVDNAGWTIQAGWPETVTYEDMTTHLLGPILGFALRLRGIVCLHASAVAVGNRAVAFLSPGGYGKSTTAAAFAKSGYPVLSDDIVALAEREDGFLVQPAYPRLRLWPSAVQNLFGSADALPRISPNHPTWDKRFLDLNNSKHKFQDFPLSLSTIYTADSDSKLDQPRIESLSASRGVLNMISNSYANHLLDGRTRSCEFDVLSRLVMTVPVRCLSVRSREDLPPLPQFCKLLIDDYLALSQKGARQR